MWPHKTLAHWMSTDKNKKVTAMSLGCGGNMLLSADNGGVVKLWDVRRLPLHSSIRSARQPEPKPVAELKHGGSVTAASFSPSGDRILTTCSDDLLRVWSADGSSLGGGGDVSSWAGVKEKAGFQVRHDNRTGRWLTTMRAVWDPANSDTFLAGSMDHELEVYSVSAKKQLARRTSDVISAVFPVLAAHPSPVVHAVVGGTASGRMYMWT